MNAKRASSHVYAPNYSPESISDEDLIRGFLLALGAGGRKEKTLHIYEESITMLSNFLRGLGLPSLAEVKPEHVRHWLVSLHQKGNKPATISVRYRSVNRLFNWCVKEDERETNPMDKVDPPRIPDTIQPYYQPREVDAVLKAIARRSLHNLRDAAIILTLYDTGVRSAEICSMRESDLDWRSRTIMVTGKNDKQRQVSLGHKAAQAIERYLRKRGVKSDWLWLGSGNKPLAINGLRMMLERRFNDAELRFRGAHAFRRGFAQCHILPPGAKKAT